MPNESWLLPLVCAPITPQPRPSYTLPSPPIRKLKGTEDAGKYPTGRNTTVGIQYSEVLYERTLFTARVKKSHLKRHYYWQFHHLFDFLNCSEGHRRNLLVSNVIKVSIFHMHHLDAGELVDTLFGASAVCHGCVVDDSSPGGSLQHVPASRGNRSPLQSRNHLHCTSTFKRPLELKLTYL